MRNFTVILEVGGSKKMKKIVFPLLALVLALGLLLPMAGPVFAANPGNEIDVVPGLPNSYYVGDTITYNVTISNLHATESMNVTYVATEFPDGTWFVPGTSNGYPQFDVPFILLPNTAMSYSPTWVVDAYYGGSVISKSHFDGVQLSTFDDPFASEAQKTSQILQAPDISIEKTVDFDGDGVYTNDETNNAGETASWRIVVCNIGDATVYNIMVTDTNGNDFGAPFDLNPGDCVSFVYDMVMNANTVNTACAEGADEAGAPVGPVCDPAQVRVPTHHVPTLSQWGMIGMAILFAALLIWSVRRRRLVSASRR
jgi:uncharacterized repeat protein (TIGR01451 family)